MQVCVGLVVLICMYELASLPRNSRSFIVGGGRDRDSGKTEDVLAVSEIAG